MKLYNRGGRTITSTAGALLPGRWLECSADEGAKLLRMFPRDLVADGAKDVGFQAEIDLLRHENAQLRKELSELKALGSPTLNTLEETTVSEEVDASIEPSEAEPEDLVAESEDTKPRGRAKKARR